MSRPDNWKESVYRICLHCSHIQDAFPGKACSSYVCNRTDKTVNPYNSGCGYWHDKKLNKGV